MWYRMITAALDTGRKPLIHDQGAREGPDLKDAAAWTGTDLYTLTTRLRGTDLPFLEGVGYLTVEIQAWASLSSFEQSGEAAGRWLRAMRAYATHALYYGPGSPKLVTPTRPSDSSPK